MSTNIADPEKENSEEIARELATGPVSVSARINSIDMLRGVAVLGILVMNIYGFAMPFVAYQNPLAYGGNDALNLGTWFFTHLFFDQKFMSIFSMLYGAGLVMMMERAEKRGRPMRGIWFRRSLWLLLIGVIHGYLIWMGDILFHYALVGMLIYPLRKLSPKALLATAACILPIALLFAFFGGAYMLDLQDRAAAVQSVQQAGDTLSDEQQATLEEWEEMAAFMESPDEQVRADLEAYRGGYSGIVEHRAPFVAMMQTQGVFAFILWRVGGLMLVGMAFMKMGILSNERDSAFYRRMLMMGYGAGLPIVALSAYLLNQHQWDALWMFQFGGIPNYIGSILVAFGHIALVMLVIQSGVLARMMERLGTVGRMAFTNYLTHSLLLTTVFYGYGIGLFGEVPRFYQMFFVVAVLALQLWLSPVWLRHFRFGPAEWLWRTLTYWRRQPMRQ